MIIQHIFMLFIFLLMCSSGSSPSLLDPIESNILITGRVVQQNIADFAVVNCSTKTRPIGGSVEFLINGMTEDHIKMDKDQCYDSKGKQCDGIYCSCLQTSNLYSWKIQMEVQNGENVACRMLFDTNRNYIQESQVSLQHNGTGFVPLKNESFVLSDDTVNTNDKTNTDNVLVSTVIILTVLVCIIGVFVVIYTYRGHKNTDKDPPESSPTCTRRYIKSSSNEEAKVSKDDDQPLLGGNTIEDREVIPTLKYSNSELKAKHTTFHRKVDQLEENIEVFGQDGRRNSLRFHNVPITSEELNQTDEKIVEICKDYTGKFPSRDFQLNSHFT